jgi:hypothetical protein
VLISVLVIIRQATKSRNKSTTQDRSARTIIEQQKHHILIPHAHSINQIQQHHHNYSIIKIRNKNKTKSGFITKNKQIYVILIARTTSLKMQ